MSDVPQDPMEPERPVTRREDFPRPTRREEMSDETRREGHHHPPDTEGLTLLPSALRDRYQSRGELPSRWGGEASLLLAEDIKDGAAVVVKVYQRGLALDTAVLGKLFTAKKDHVVKLHYYGESDGRWYEVQEYIGGGTLDEFARQFPDGRMPRTELRAVIKELAAAVDYLHGLGVMHKDLKPANILVRSLEPFDLVLADFGLASLTDLSMRAVSQSRTAAYSAPELRAGFAGWASDWWSVGIIVAELAGGAHPFAGLQEQAIDFAVAMRPVPLDRVQDPEVANLCRGLLVRDTEERWGEPEIAAWLKGEAPHVPEEAIRPAHVGREPERGFEFNSTSYVEPGLLARAFAGAWADAARLVGGANQRNLLVGWMRDNSMSQGVARLLDEWDGTNLGPDKRVAQILSVLDPDLPVAPFRSVDLTVDSLPGLADEVLAGPDDTPEGKILNDIFDQAILPVYRRHDPRLSQIHDRWSEATQRAVETLESCSSQSGFTVTPAIRTRLRAQTLRIASDRAAAENVAHEVEAIRRDARGAPDSIAWFKRLADLPPSPEGGLEVALAMLAPLAHEQVERERQQAAAAREREREAERERRRAQLALRLTRARRGLRIATGIIGIHAVALYVAQQNVDRLTQLAAELRFEGNIEGAGWIDRAIDFSSWYWLPAILALAGLVVARWARARRNLDSPRAVATTLRATQAVAAAQVAASPLLWVFGLRWAFVSRSLMRSRTGAPAGWSYASADRRWGIVGAWLLASYGIALKVLGDHEWGHHLLESWPDDLLLGYAESWPTGLHFNELLANHGWTVDFALVFAAAALALAWRSYATTQDAELWVLRLIGVLGLAALLVAPISTVPVAATLLALFFVASIVVDNLMPYG
jgi:serine/threonine protein kinase